jgi:predicted MFS family arabinose efflux permease
MAIAAVPASRLVFKIRPLSEKKIYPRSPGFYRFLISFALWSLAIGGFSPFFTVYFSKYLQTPLKQIGTIYSISHLAQLIAILAAPFLFRRVGLVTGIVSAQITTALALLCLAVAAHTPAATAVYVSYVAFQWMSEPGVLSLLLKQVSPAEQAGASSLQVLSGSVSQAIAASLAGMSFLRFGYPPVLACLSAVAVAAALTFQLLLGQSTLQQTRTSGALLGSSLGVRTEQR